MSLSENKGIELSVSSYGDVKGEQYHMAVLPWGATEPHNLHLPYLTDAILSRAVSVDAARLALDMGARCMVLPAVTLGSQNPGQHTLPFCIHARYRTQYYMLHDTVSSLYGQEIRRLVIVNGHGGNNFKNMIRDLAVDFPGFLIATLEWYRLADAHKFFDEPGDHADELETSAMMHYCPQLVDLSRAGSGESRGFVIESLADGSAWIPRDWSKISVDTGIGDPRKASPDKGRAFVGEAAAKLSRFFVEFAFKNLY